MNRLVNANVKSEVDGAAVGEPSNIVDGLSSTYLSATVPADKELVITFDLNSNRDWFNRYSIQSAATNPAADPSEWQLLGSFDGEQWYQLDYRTNEVFSERKQTREFALKGQLYSFAHLRLILSRRARRG